jgi:8-oxo-dGTP pyrophosphatase MutT (NUDIX family)
MPTKVANRLIDLLGRHEPSDAVETAHRDFTVRWLGGAADPLNRNHFDPGHAVGSALICAPDRRHVMLVMHAKLNRWLQAGGHAEVGETDLLKVACREAWEEVGLNLDCAAGRFCDIDIHEVPARGVAPRHLHFDFRFMFESPVAPARAASDALEARWFTIEEALGLPLDDGLRRMIGKV